MSIKTVVYDIETLKNCLTFCFLDCESKKKKEFVLYDDMQEFGNLYNFLLKLKKSGYYMIGFNNLGFDAQIIEKLLALPKQDDFEYLSIEDIVTILYEFAQELINLPDEEKFKVTIPEWRMSIPQIDLYKQKHYDRPQRATSLKWLQFTMRYHTVEEMPISHGICVYKDMIPSILKYNWNDVDSTAEFFEKIAFETELRQTLSDRYDLPLLNASEPKMVREIFGKLLSEDMGIPYADLKKTKTFRKSIKIKDIIFPYVKFLTPDCQEVMDWFVSLDVNPNEKTEGVEKIIQFGQCETVFGLGGIHGCIAPGRYKSTEDLVIEDVDVVSFYPNLAIQNGIRPEHLGETFNKIYNNIFQERKSIPKKDPMNYVFKIILNSAYGLSKEINGYLYDPLFTYSITVNGQLTILMLAEMLKKYIPNIIFYQMNTDGISIGYNPKYKEKVARICKWFCETTKLELENVFYKEMIIRDVNNYIGIYTDGKTKKKGSFETETDYHKNPSFSVIPKAVEQYFVYGKDYRVFIENHEDVYDFLGAVKKKHNFDLNLYTLYNNLAVAEPQQKVFRFYVANDGRRIIKEFTDGRKNNKTAILKDWVVEPAYVIDEQSSKEIFNNLNYTFYIKEVEKRIAEIESSRTQIKLF